MGSSCLRRRSARAREAAITDQLPDVVDLLVTAHGDGLDGAAALAGLPAARTAPEAALARRSAQHFGGLLAQLLVDRLSAVALDRTAYAARSPPSSHGGGGMSASSRRSRSRTVAT